MSDLTLGEIALNERWKLLEIDLSRGSSTLVMRLHNLIANDDVGYVFNFYV